MRITVLGAGYMGTAMALVASQRGHDVRLWGTWLDDPMLDPPARGEVHPRLKLPLTGLTTLRAAALAEALTGAELVICGVNSDGVLEVMRRARPHLPNVPILAVTKGLLENAAHRMDRIDVCVSEVLGRDARWVHASGPAKAMEVARGVFTWMHFAGNDAAQCAAALRSDCLHITETADIAGAELCSALKNAYATGLGLWDGAVGAESHNARAACFTQAIVEMERIVRASGGLAETVYGASGVGDLHVTAAAGRNRLFGERVGRGRKASDVAREMAEEGLLTEGYAAIASALRYAGERNVPNVPLLRAIHAVIWEDQEPKAVLAALRL
jgi:glycerol-3-phosphate dehydrogenase (NAD(P)+)